MNTRALLDLIDRIALLRAGEARASGAKHGLPGVQLDALRYLASCNRYSDTPATVSEYLDTTRGTMSQTLIALERKGLIHKVPDRSDGRVVHCRLTGEGYRVVAETAEESTLSAAANQLDTTDKTTLVDLLGGIADGMVSRGRGRHFDRCNSCLSYHVAPSGETRCKLMGDVIEPQERQRLCRFHQATEA